MRFYRKFLFFVSIYLISDSKWILVKFADTLAIANPSLGSGADTTIVGSYSDIATGDDAKGGSSETSELKLFKDDGSGNPAEMETTDFSQNNYSGYLIYEFKPRVECTLVKFRDAEVWKKGDDGVDEPISVSYNSDEHKVVLFDEKKSVFYKKNNSGNWVYYNTIDGTRSRSAGHSSSKAGTPGSGSSSFTLKPEIASTLAPGSAECSEKADESSKDTSGEGDDTDESSCDSDPTHTGGESGYGSGAITPPEGGADGQSDGKESLRGATSPTPNLSESSPSTPPTSGGDSSTVKTDQDGTGTTPSETVKKTAFELDIKKDAGTNEFDYKKDNKIATFTAKDDYAFSVVKQDKNEIWKTEKETEYATEVVLNGKGQKEKIVTIHLLNGTTKSYKKDGQNKPWIEHTGELPSTDYTKYKLGFELNIKSEGMEPDNDHFNLEKPKGCVLYLITFMPRVECSSVKVDGEDVWQYDKSKSKDVNPRKVAFHKSKLVAIYFGEIPTYYKKTGDKWEVYDPKKKSTTNSTSGGSTGTSG